MKLNAKDALEHFRTERNGPTMALALAGFKELSVDDRLEILFWTMMGTNNALQWVMDELEVKHVAHTFGGTKQ